MIAVDTSSQMTPSVQPQAYARETFDGSGVLRTEELRELLELGAMAPSGGNVQPWRARATSSSVELFLDSSRSNSLIDVNRCASLMALGSFTENVTIAANRLGLVHDVAVQDEEDPAQLIVRFSFRGRTSPSEADPLHPCIRTRCTNRHSHRGDPIPPHQIDELGAAASSLDGGHRASFVSTEADRRAAARLLGRADRLRMLNRELHDQMFSELRWTAEAADASRDGIDAKSLELPTPFLLVLKLMRSYFFVRRFFPKLLLELLSRKLILQSSHICVLALPGPLENPCHSSFITAGRVLQRLWLTAEHLRLGVQPWAVLPFFLLRAVYANGVGFSASEREEVLSLGEELRALFGVPAHLVPYFILRLSNAPAPSVRARRLDWRSFTAFVGDRTD